MRSSAPIDAQAARRFSPISTIGGNTLCLVAPASLPARTLAEFAAHAKASAKPLMRGANNVGEDMVAGQVTGALGFTLERVPYKGAVPAITDLLANRVQLLFTSNKNAELSIRLVDPAGKVVLVEKQKVQPGANTLQLRNLDRFAAGTYLVQVILEGEVLTARLVLSK